RHFAYHVWASWALLIFFAGKHPTLGYYAYPAALSSIALGMMASQVMRRIARLVARHSPRPLGVLPWVVPVLLLSAFLPGGGLRTIWANVRHLNDRAYDAHALARDVMRDIPPRALTAVDGAFVLDFYLADRPVIEATIHRLSYDFRTRPFEYVVFARDRLRRFLPRTGGLVLIPPHCDRRGPLSPHAVLR